MPSFDELVEPHLRTILPLEAEESRRPILDGDSDEIRAMTEASEPSTSPSPYTLRRIRTKAYARLGTMVAAVTIGAGLELGSNLLQAIGAAAFGAVALALDAPDEIRAIRKTRKATRARRRAHGE